MRKLTISLLFCSVLFSVIEITAQMDNTKESKVQEEASFGDISNMLYSGYLPGIIKTSIEAGIFELLDGKSLSSEEISA
ncbi:MAG: hypothetical protein AAGI25_15415 [Bacteroidota bacterium]